MTEKTRILYVATVASHERGVRITPVLCVEKGKTIVSPNGLPLTLGFIKNIKLAKLPMVGVSSMAAASAALTEEEARQVLLQSLERHRLRQQEEIKVYENMIHDISTGVVRAPRKPTL